MEDQADQFRKQKKHNGLLLVAASRGYLAEVEELLELGASLDCKDKRGRVPLHFAAGNGRTAVARHLWSLGAEVDAETPEGRTPLHLAALGGHAEVATLLLQKGAWAEAEDAGDDTPLHLAARQGHSEVVEALLRHGAKAAAVAGEAAANKAGLTPLGCALVGGHVAAATLLLSWGAALGDRPHGYSLLHLAAGMAQPASVAFLLQRGTDPNECDNRERVTPLHSAALGGCPRCAQALLEAGADAGLADGAGRLPADLAPEQDARLRGLLQPKGPQTKQQQQQKAAAAASSSAAQPSQQHQVQQSAQAAFRSLPATEQRSKVERWSLMDSADLAAALRQYPANAAAEVSARVSQLQGARRLLNIHKATAALHGDDDFQADLAQAHVRQAIDAIRGDTSRYEQYAADPRVLAVLQKMRRLHGVAQANGQRTVSLEDMAAQPGHECRDRERQLVIEATCGAHLAAAAAAAGSEAGEAVAAARAAHAAWIQAAASGVADTEAAARPGGKGSSAGAGSGGGSAAPAGSAPSAMLRQRLLGGGGGRGRTALSSSAAAARAAGDEASASAIEEAERDRSDADVPAWMIGEFSWKKVWHEFLGQAGTSLAVLLVFGAVAWLVRGRAPWAP